MPEDYVLIRNNGDKRFDYGQVGHPYAIDPDDERPVPWNVMCVWLGDPELRDSPKHPARQEERARLHLYYGVTSGVPGDNRPSWEDAMPRLSVTTLTGEPVYTVAVDPEGHSAQAAPLLDDDSTATQIALLKQRLADLEASTAPSAAAISQSDSLPAPVPDIASQPPADAPAPRRTRKQQGAIAAGVEA